MEITPPAENAGSGARVVGGAKRARRGERRLFPFQYFELGAVEHLGIVQRGEDMAEPFGDHRFSRSRRAFEQEVVHPRGRDECGPFGVFLPFDVAEIERIALVVIVVFLAVFDPVALERCCTGLRRWEFLCAQKVQGVGEGADAVKGDPRYFGEFGKADGRDDGSLDHPLVGQREDDGVEEGVFGDAAVQPQLPEHIPPLQHRFGIPQCDERGDREVEMRPFLAQVAGGEVDSEAFGREGKIVVEQRRFDPLPGFIDRRVGHPDDAKSGEPLGRGKLYFDRFGVDPLERGTQQLFHKSFLLRSPRGDVNPLRSILCFVLFSVRV